MVRGGRGSDSLPCPNHAHYYTLNDGDWVRTLLSP